MRWKDGVGRGEGRCNGRQKTWRDTEVKDGEEREKWKMGDGLDYICTEGELTERIAFLSRTVSSTQSNKAIITR